MAHHANIVLSCDVEGFLGILARSSHVCLFAGSLGVSRQVQDHANLSPLPPGTLQESLQEKPWLLYGE